MRLQVVRLIARLLIAPEVDKHFYAMKYIVDET